MEPDLPQHDLIATYLNAREYYFATFLSHKEKFAARFKSVFNFFYLRNFLRSNICVSWYLV